MKLYQGMRLQRPFVTAKFLTSVDFQENDTMPAPEGYEKPRLLTPRQAETYSSVSKSTLYREHQSCRLKLVKLGPNTARVETT
jgi:hypothetical protein